MRKSNSDNESSIHQVTLGINFAKSRFSSQAVGTYSYLDTIYGGYEAFLLGSGSFTSERSTVTYLGTPSALPKTPVTNWAPSRDPRQFHDQQHGFSRQGDLLRPVHLADSQHEGTRSARKST